MPYADPERQRTFQREWKKQTKDWFFALKRTLRCVSCGFAHPAALQFHHVDGKDAEVGRMVQQNANRDAIMAEIAKCQVLCANCHAIRHFDEGYKGGRPRKSA